MKRSSLLIAAASLLAPFAAHAQTFQNPSSVASAAAGSAVVGGVFLFVACIFLLAFAFFILWVFMVIDCLKREWADKNTWLIILIVSIFVGLHWLSAILYFVLVKQKNLGTIAVPQMPPTPPSAPKA